jgi:hypothetical protein
MKRMGHGFIIVLTMMLISASVLLVSLVINRVSAYRRMGNLFNEGAKARMIALGGIEIAMSQLAQLNTDQKQQEPKASDSEKKEKEKDHAKKEAEKAKAVATVLLDYVNTWQTFQLKQGVEGIDGECKLYISSEEGKINLNGLYDTQKKKFVTLGTVDGKQFCEFISEKLKPLLERQNQKPIDLGSLIEDFFKNHQSLDDITELFESTLKGITLFVEPDMKTVAFMDLFTTLSPKNTIDPLVISAALGKVIGLNRTKDAKKIPPDELLKLIKQEKIEWEKSWQPLLATIYGKEYSVLPTEIKPFLATRFEPTLWSVVSYGKVGSVTSKVCALIEKNKKSDQPFQVKKLYWLS